MPETSTGGERIANMVTPTFKGQRLVNAGGGLKMTVTVVPRKKGKIKADQNIMRLHLTANHVNELQQQ